MRYLTIFYAITVSAILFAVAKPDYARADRQGSIDTAAQVAAKPASAPMPDAPKSDEKEEALQKYVLFAMQSWAPARTMPRKDVSHYIFIARDISDVVLSEAPLWKSDTSRGRTAILVATIGFFESRYWVHVLDGRCNDATWKKSREGIALMSVTGNCDAGWAYGFGQVHPEGGIVLTPDGEWKHAWDEPGAKGVIVGADMIKDTRIAVRVVLHMLRKSLRLTGGLTGYTGEGSCPCPKAKQRLEYAESWSRKHPFALP